MHAGIATHFCDSAKIPELEYSLLHLNNPRNVESVINDFCPKIQSEFSLAKNLDQINECFDASSVEEILRKLEYDGSQWAKKTTKVFQYYLIFFFNYFYLFCHFFYFFSRIFDFKSNKNSFFVQFLFMPCRLFALYHQQV